MINEHPIRNVFDLIKQFKQTSNKINVKESNN